MKHRIYRSLPLLIIVVSIVAGIGADPQGLLGQSALLSETFTKTVTIESPESLYKKSS